MSKLQRVLLVDDDVDIRTIATLALARVGGLDVVAVSSGEECLEIADEGFDLILLDVMMPGLDGPATLALLKQGPAASVPVIFLTAKARRQELDRIVELGAVGAILKPFDPMKLSDDIREMLLETS